jgi:hypothetical protein
LTARRIETVHPGPDAVVVRNQSFRWAQSLASVLWIVIAVNLWATSPSPGLAVVAGVLVAASLVLLWRTLRSGIVRLDVAGVDIFELSGTRHLDRSDIQWFATEARSGREHLTVRLTGDDTVVMRWVYSTSRRAQVGPSEVRQAADALNRVLWDLRADQPDPPDERPST